MAHAARPPGGLRQMGGVRGPRCAGPRRADAPIPDRPVRPARLRAPERRGAGDAGGLRGRRQRLHRFRAASRRAHAGRRRAGKVAAVGLPRGLQGTSHPDGCLRGEALAGKAARRVRPEEGCRAAAGPPRRPAHRASGGRVRRRRRGRPAAPLRSRRRHRRDARDRLGEQQLGSVRREDGLWQAADGRRPPQGARHAQRLLPEPRRLPRVRRGRPVVPGVPGLPALRTQRQCRVVRHSRRGRLPGRVRRAVQGRPASPLPVRRRVAGGRCPARGAEGPRRRGRGDRRHRHPSRPGHSRGPEAGLRNRLPLHLHGRPEPDGPVPASDAEGRRRRRAGRGGEGLGRPVQQLRLHRRPRRHPVPEQGPASRSQHGERLASRAGMVGRVRVDAVSSPSTR